ncbi:MAG: M23 family metallopeptidase [Pseudonocardiaceae bacterium]
MVAAVAFGAVTAATQGVESTEETDSTPLARAFDLTAAFTGVGGNAPAADVLPLPEVLPVPQETLEEDVASLAKGFQIADDRAEAARVAAEEAAAEAAEEAASEGLAQLPVAAGDVVMPAVGRLTSGFGARWGTNHNGIDIANKIGTPIYATTDGVVAESGPASGFGMWVRVEHPDGTTSVYGHINESLVEEGEKVAAGEQIATIGNRGQSTGPHLHFEIWTPGGFKINPLSWLRENGVGI